MRGQRMAVQDALYFGTATPKGAVSPEDWARFVETVVTPRFPQGLTVWRAAGQWRSADGVLVRESSNVLTLVHPDDDGNDIAVREMIDAYKAQFRQEAVMRLRSLVCVSY